MICAPEMAIGSDINGPSNSSAKSNALAFTRRPVEMRQVA